MTGTTSDLAAEVLDLERLPEDIRGDEKAQLTLKPYLGKPLGEFLRGHMQLASKLGQSLTVPEANAPAEDWQRVWSRLGRPESPDQYDLDGIQVPEGLPWNADTDKALTAKAHELGLTNAQLRGLREAYIGLRGAEHEGLAKVQTEALTKAQETLRGEWGADYDKRLELASRAAKAAFGDGFEEAKQLRLADGSFLLDNPAIARAFEAVGARMAEPGALPGLNDGSGGGGENAQAEIDRLRATEAYTNARHPEHAATHKKVMALYTQLFPGNAAA